MMSSNQQINNKRHSKKSMFSSEESPKKQRIEDEKEKAVGHVVASASVTVETTSSIMAKIEMVPQPLENGLYLSKVECLGSQANSRALSLFELIRAIRPIASIHFNFCIDPGWVLRQYSRSLRNCPISFIVGQRHLPALKAECSKWSNVQCAGVPLPFAYGTHHTKLSLFESETALHVVVSTSNLLEEDWALKTQAFYHWRAPFPPDATETEEETLQPQKGRMQQPENFRDDLVEYLQKGYPKSAGSASQLVSYWLDRIMGGKADFSKCPDRLVGSVPGRYFKSIGEFSKFGHLKLRALLARNFSTEELQANKTFIGQFSSLGSLGAKPESWLCTEFLDSLSGGAKSQSLPNSCLKLVYPTVENVRQSLEGYAAGLSLPYTSEVHKRQPYLRQFLHQWKSERHGRSLAMPHVKSYTALDDQGQPQWLLVTSANLSGSAWGKLEKEGNQLFLRSFELGVLLCAKDHPEGLLLSFDLPLTKYSPEDQQFLVDLRYAQMPDTNGFRGARDVRQLTSNSIQRIHLSNSSNTSNQII